MDTEMTQMTAAQVVSGTGEGIYDFIADYRNEHQPVLSDEYAAVPDLAEGNPGAGTIVRFQVRFLGQVQILRAFITEPEPGHVRVETDIKADSPTSFILDPLSDDRHSQPAASSEPEDSNALDGFIVDMVLQEGYSRELELVIRMAEAEASSSQLLPGGDAS